MALQEATQAFLKRLRLAENPTHRLPRGDCTRYASTQATTAKGSSEAELEETSFLSTSTPSNDKAAVYDPAENARGRKRQLPSSRYKFRPPKYYRGPLHPHQPPAPSDSASRQFRPGPFSLPRIEQTYNSTIAPDLMTLAYQHYPPGYNSPKKGDRLRSWDGASPYFKNRPLRGPRGGDVLKLLRRPMTFRNVPKLERITVHTFVKGAMDDSAHLHVAGMVMQAITNVRAEVHEVQKSMASFGVRKGQHLSVTCELYGEDMQHFLSKVVEVVAPKIKDWKGVKGSSGDSSGNIAFGFTGEEVALFPEVEVNYDMYPPRMIPGCHVMVHTSATTDREARLLLGACGLPFYGKLIN